MWQPALDPGLLRKRAELSATLRQFFAERNVVEVDVPVLGSCSVTDPNLSSVRCRLGNRDYYLQTSPEYFMKRLLAAGCDSIYSLGKSFRSDEVGPHHNPEFTMLEWYRVGIDEQQLIDEVAELIARLSPAETVQKIEYQQLFRRYIGVDPHSANADELSEVAREAIDIDFDIADKNTWLDILFSHLIEPHLIGPTVVFDYPASQCALAKIEKNTAFIPVAKRFELFWRGMELANGYWELTDAHIQRERFQHDIETRIAQGKDLPEMDEKFIAAMQFGLPECSGVALGVDRLFMCLEGLTSIEQAMPFSFSRV